MPCLFSVHGTRHVLEAVIPMKYVPISHPLCRCPAHSPNQVTPVKKWRRSRGHGTLVLLGEKGKIVRGLNDLIYGFVRSVGVVIDAGLI